MKICVVGAGAGGLFCAGFLKQKGYDVTILEQNEKAGKKLYISGKGRCNVTNLCETEEFLKNVVRGSKFLYGAISEFSPKDTMEFFENLNVLLKVERGNRVFPYSDNATDIIDALKKHCQGVKFKFNTKVLKIEKTESDFKIETNEETLYFDKVVLATGGKSYPLTGSSGDGYKFAKNLGHNIIFPVGGLCAIELEDKFIDFQGISLKNVSLNAETEKSSQSFFGEMLFTDRGISGPIVLSMSSAINRDKNIQLSIDFKPALSEEKLRDRMVREFDSAQNKEIKSVIFTLLPRNMADSFLEKCGINPEQKVNTITKQQRESIVKNLKKFNLNFKCLYPIESAIITSGGVDLKEVDPKTMESKICKGLYFCGEVLDIDAMTGGFNLQIAFATAYRLSSGM